MLRKISEGCAVGALLQADQAFAQVGVPVPKPTIFVPSPIQSLQQFVPLRFHFREFCLQFQAGAHSSRPRLRQQPAPLTRPTGHLSFRSYAPTAALLTPIRLLNSSWEALSRKSFNLSPMVIGFQQFRPRTETAPPIQRRDHEICRLLEPDRYFYGIM